MSHSRFRRTYLILLIFVCCSPAAPADEAKKTPTLEDAYRAFYAGMASGKKDEQIKAFKAFLPTRKDVEVLFPKHADIVWINWEAAQNRMIEYIADVAREATRDGKIEKINKHDLRADKTPTTGYKRVLAMIPSNIPVYHLDIHQEKGSGGMGDFLFVNGRWIFFGDINQIPDLLDKKAKEALKKVEPGQARIRLDDKPLTKREKRMLRWTLSFGDITEEEYVKQMQELGAILAFPTAKNEYRVVRELSKRPVEEKAEDIAKINRIYWFDKKAESVRSVCKLLGIKGSPDYFIAFFPEKLENELFDKELKYKNLKEDDIQETKFKVIRRGDALEVKVVEQKAIER